MSGKITTNTTWTLSRIGARTLSSALPLRGAAVFQFVMKASLTLRIMQAADLDFADSLRAMAGWNQTRADWQRFLMLEPDGCFIAEWKGRPAGTATTTCFGTQLAWIGMVLVHPEFRRQGIGRALLERCLDSLSERRVTCVKLDATPLGKPLYEQLGFKEEWKLTRWKAEAKSVSSAAEQSQAELRIWSESEFTVTNKLDQAAFGVSRERLLSELISASRRTVVATPASGLGGYGILRTGSSAAYLGPFVANSDEAGVAIANDLVRYAAGSPLYWDIPDANEPARSIANALGFIPQRPLVRMFRGSNDWPGKPIEYFGIADPALG